MEKPNSVLSVAKDATPSVTKHDAASVPGAHTDPFVANGAGEPVPRVPLPAFDKKALAKLSRQYNMHYLLIMEQDGVSKPNAQFRAWLEGPQGLGRRMEPDAFEAAGVEAGAKS